MIKRMVKNSDTQISAHIHSSEIDCHCENPECTATWYSEEVIALFERLRLVWSEPIMIHSFYRCCYQNANIPGAKTSTHTGGLGIDLHCPDEISYEWFAYKCSELFGFTYEYPESRSIHCDTYRRD